MTLVVDEWKRRHSRLASRWQHEDNANVAAFMLRAKHEPYCIKPVSLAVLSDGDLVGRFSYRLIDGLAFVGIYLQPAARNRGIGLEASCKGIHETVAAGAREIWCSVAAPNRPAIWLNAALGYRFDGTEDWRILPDGFCLEQLIKWRCSDWRFLPEPAVLYKRMVLDVSGWGN